MSSPLIIVEDNISVAWGKAFLKVFHAREITPLVVEINSLDNPESPEIPSIRNALDAALAKDGKGLCCHQVANTIFPISLWNSKADRHNLYKRYLKIFPRIQKYLSNRNGVYFQRFILFGHDGNMQDGVNQLEHIIQTWNGGNHRRSALQAAAFDPHVDHTHQRQRGFPCLQQVAFAPLGSDGLTVTGFYATQYIFERAYGNYLGLCRLGRFMAHEMGLRLDKVTCIATPAIRSNPKKKKADLKDLAQQVEVALAGFADGADSSIDEGSYA